MDPALAFILIALVIVAVAVIGGKFIGPNDDRY